MKNKIGLMAMMAMAMMGESYKIPAQQPLTDDQRQRMEAANEEIVKRNRGMKLWDIGGIKVWARNKKNAIRKANNIKNSKP